ncbi:hypothetical protein DFH09DRAFT_1313980 [Mycena vulgaris]|nr:hypothetical protein DFH09DRAFT_1313980 [Mycena vulgaris]
MLTVGALSREVFKCIPQTIRSSSSPQFGTPPMEEVLTAVWTLFCNYFPLHNGGDLSILEEGLATVLRTKNPALSPSVIAITQWAVLTEVFSERTSLPDHHNLGTDLNAEDWLLAIRHPILPVTTAIEFPPELFACDWARNQGTFKRLVPFKASETMRKIGEFMPYAAIHATHQIRFARAVEALFKIWANNPGDEDEATIIRNQLINLDLFAFAAPDPADHP